MGPVGYVSVILFLFFIFVLGFFIEDRINGLLQGMRTNYPGVCTVLVMSKSFPRGRGE